MTSKKRCSTPLTTLRDGAWSGGRCVVVGGGDSLRGFDWELLRNERCIVINRAYINVPWADLFFTEDLRFVREFSQRPDWDTFSGTRVVHCLDPKYEREYADLDPELVLLRKVKHKCWGRTFSDGLSYASNSGIGAINLATILDADPIYLLGFDCRRQGEKSNYHDDYPKSWQTGDDQYRNFLADMIHWVKPHVRDRRVFNVVNSECPSAIPDAVFPWVRAGEVFGENKNHRLP